jgi:hypothetical protein
MVDAGPAGAGRVHSRSGVNGVNGAKTGRVTEPVLDATGDQLIRIIVTVHRWIAETGGRSTGTDLQ